MAPTVIILLAKGIDQLLVIAASKKFKLVGGLIVFILFSHLHAYDLNASVSLDTNISLKDEDSLCEYIPKKRKSSNKFYREFKKLFSDYDKNWVEDMVTYSVDMVMPDEMMLATEDVSDHRDEKGLGNDTKNIPKKLGHPHQNKQKLAIRKLGLNCRQTNPVKPKHRDYIYFRNAFVLKVTSMLHANTNV